ncbi:MAG: hypothetical protein Q9181_007065 [Wetmoreana brouardii]
MEKLPLELLNGVVQCLTNDLPSLKALRLTAKGFSDATIQYIYSHLILYNNAQSWDKFKTVLGHEKYSHFVKAVESSSLHDETCIFQKSYQCDHDLCRRLKGYLNEPFVFTVPQSLKSLKFRGFHHLLGSKLEQIATPRNIRKLELDLSLLVGNDEEEIPLGISPGWVPRWILKSDAVRDLSLIQHPASSRTDRQPLVINFLWLFLNWSGLETLFLKHTAGPANDLEHFLRNQSDTLTSLRIIEPVMSSEQLQTLKENLDQVVPNLQLFECTDSYAPQHPDMEVSEWYRKLAFARGFPGPPR